MKSPASPTKHAVLRSPPCLLVFVFAIALILPMQPDAFAQPAAAPAQGGLTATEWREDLRFLAENLPKTHKNLFHTMTRDEFDGAVKALDADIPNLDGYAIYIRLIQLCARSQDGHSRLVRGAPRAVPGSLFLPVGFVRQADVIHVQGAAPSYAAAVGGKVAGVGRAGWEEALNRMATLMPHDPGNDGHQLWNAAVDLAHSRLLRGLGLGNPDGSADLAIKKAGKRTTFTMKGGTPTGQWFTSGGPTGWVDARPASAPVPLSSPHADDPQWITLVPEHRAVYFQFNGVQNGEQETLAQAAQRRGTMLERDDVDRLGIDLRNNSGGDNTLLARYDAWIADPAHAYLTDPESQLNDYACSLLGAKRLREAIAVFDVNARRHPKSANAFDSLGEGCAAAGDTMKAVESYRRSVELNPGAANGKAALERRMRREPRGHGAHA